MALKLLGKDGFYGWVNMAVLFVYNIALFFVMNAFAFCLPFWAEKPFYWNRGWISGAQTLNLILGGLAAPLVGIFLMKQGPRKAMVIGNLLSTLGLFMIAFQHHLWELYLWAGVVVGLGMSIGGMLAMMTVTNNWFIMKRSIALVISMGSFGLNVVISPILMSMIHSMGWRESYMIVGVISLVLCVIVPGLLIRNKPEDLGQAPDGPISTKAKIQTGNNPYKNVYKTSVDFTAKEALRTRTMWLLVSLGTIQFFCMNGLLPHQIQFLLDIKIPDNTAARASGLMSAIMAISTIATGFLGLRFKMRSLAITSIAVGIIGYAALLWAQSLSMVIVYCVILGIAFGIQAIAMGNLYPDYFGRSEFPKIMGYAMPVTIIASSVGGMITGFIRQQTGHYHFAFQLFLVLSFVALLCMIFAKPPVHPSLKNKVQRDIAEPQLVG
jgi:MFS family permease